MPELPEVENRLLYLQATALGHAIDRVEVSEPRIVKCCSADTFKRRLKGRRMVSATRRGKYLVVGLDNGRILLLHFTMGGDLKYYRDPADKPRYSRFELVLDNGYRLAFTCPRNICRVMVVDSISQIPGLRDMGPEPLGDEFTIDRLRQILSASPNRRIKPFLMDQNKIAGIGNIYADEILFGTHIRPTRAAGGLSKTETRLLYNSIRKILGEAIATGGEEEFPATYLISRESRGVGCPRCGHEIEKTTVGGRTTRHCPICQR
ncbi:MAG TPA: DNA-formamidopyrimidine glycosylase family protein [Blastocatellia bacterium]